MARFGLWWAVVVLFLMRRQTKLLGRPPMITGILANTITADMGLIPGLGIIGPLFGLPLSVMAAVIERPFLTVAGLKQGTVWYSIQANFVSLLAGYPLVCLAAGLASLGDGALLLWPFAAVLISTIIERAYINKRVGGPVLPLGWALAANVVSALTCILILVPVRALDRPEIKQALLPYRTVLSVVLGLFCVAAVVGSFVVPRHIKVSLQPPGQR